MSHYHLATVVKFDPSSFQKTPHTTFPCLHLLTKQGVPNSLEHLYIYAHNGSDIPSIETEFLLADFKYMNGSKIVRAKVLCPMLNKNQWIKINDNFYKVPIQNVNPIGGLTGCSPLGYAYNNGTKIYSYKINGNDYAAMYCFPDEGSSAIGPYFAFCEVKPQDINNINHEWGHNSDPWHNGQFLSHDNVTSHP